MTTSQEERMPPERLTKLRDAWCWLMTSWRVFHYTLGIGGTVFATAVAAQPALLKAVPYLLDSLAWLSAACIGVLGGSRRHRRPHAKTSGWSLSSDGTNR